VLAQYRNRLVVSKAHSASIIGAIMEAAGNKPTSTMCEHAKASFDFIVAVATFLYLK
jgi:hypothetical protein